jgi:arylsulfatase A
MITRNFTGGALLSALIMSAGCDSLQKEHVYLYWEFHERGGRQAVRMGNWKAVRYNVFEGNRSIELYDLKSDPSESNDLADQYPEIAERMAEIMTEARTESEIFTFQATTVRGQ